MSDDPAFLVFWGTLTTLVRAPDEEAAFARFLARLTPRGEDDSDRTWDGQAWSTMGDLRREHFGRLIPPVRDEVTIRRPRADDRGWIEDSRDPAFLALLPELVAS